MDALKLGPKNRLYIFRLKNKELYRRDIAWSLFTQLNIFTIWTWHAAANVDVGERLLNCAQQAHTVDEQNGENIRRKFKKLHYEIDHKQGDRLNDQNVNQFFTRLQVCPGDILIVPHPYDMTDVRVVRVVSPIQHISKFPQDVINIQDFVLRPTEKGLFVDQHPHPTTCNYFFKIEPIGDNYIFNRYDSPSIQIELQHTRCTCRRISNNLIKDVQEALDDQNPLLRIKKAQLEKISSTLSFYSKTELQQLASRYLTRCGANEVTCDTATDDEAFAVTGSFFNLRLDINIAVHAAADGQLTTDLLPQVPDDDSVQNLSWLMTNLPSKQINEDVLKQARTAHVRIIALEELASLILDVGADLLDDSGK